MNMNFGFAENFNVVETGDYLRGGEIHKNVKLTSVTLDEVANKQDPSIKYTVLDFVFTNESGAVYNHRIFEPNEQSGNRFKSVNGKDMPSSWEYDKFVIGDLLSTLVPNKLAKLQKDATSLKSFKEYASLVAKALTNVTETFELKLILDKRKYARLPYCVSINKAGEAFLSSHFIGEGLTFSSYEIDQIKKINDAAPTTSHIVENASIDEDEIDVDNIDFDDEEL